MTLHAAVAELVDHLREQAHELSVLSTIVAQDAPPERSSFVDRLQEDIEASRGLAAEALAAAQAALDASSYPPDAPSSRRNLTAAHRALAQLGRSLSTEVGSSRHMDELRRLAATPAEGWAGWASVVRDTIERCLRQLHGVNDDLVLACEEAIDPELLSVAVSVRMPHGSVDHEMFAPGELTRQPGRSEDLS